MVKSKRPNRRLRHRFHLLLDRLGLSSADAQILARSLSSSEALIRNEVLLWPKGLNLNAYRLVLSDAKYTWSLLWTAIFTVVYTVVAMTMTMLCAYPFTYEKLKGRRFINALILFTMYFNAGTIPMYLLLKDLRLLNQPLVLIIPNA